MPLRATNLNLLPVLRALLREGSVSRAAAVLGLSQPATSTALAKLRDVLGDPLLVQTGRRVRLTPRAEALRPTIEGICGSIEAMLLNAAFVPARERRDFVVATPDYMALLLGPALLGQLAQVAPGISVRFADVGADFLGHLADGDIDIAIVAQAEGAVRGFQVQAGYIDRLVGVVAADHPFARNPPARFEDMLAYPRLGIDTKAFGPQGQLPALLEEGGGPLRMSVSHLLVLPLLAAETSGVAIVPEALARRAARMTAVAMFELPAHSLVLDLCMMWSPALDADPAHRWFRGEVDKAMRVHFRK